MTDRIKVNTELLTRCAGELKTTAQGFEAAAALLAGLNTGEEWWTKAGRFTAIRLQDEGSSTQLADAGATVRSLTAAMRRYNGRLTKLGDTTARAAALFSETENRLYSRARGQDAGSDGNIIGAPGTAGPGSLITGSVAVTAAASAPMLGDVDWLKHIRKVIGKAGVIGKTISAGWGLIGDYASGKLKGDSIAKYLVDGGKIIADWAKLNKRYSKLANLGKDYANKLKWKEMLGLNKFWSGKNAASRLSQASSGLDRFKANFSKQFRKGMTSKSTWVVAGLTSGINNIAQHMDGLKTGSVKVDRVLVEWATETAGTVAIGAATTALAGAGLAAVGVTGAPVILVGATAYGLSCAADWAFKGITGSDKGIAESVGDAVGDFYDSTLKPGVIKGAKKIGEGMQKMGNWLTSKAKAAWGW